jgi:hypothetical protein
MKFKDMVLSINQKGASFRKSPFGFGPASPSAINPKSTYKQVVLKRLNVDAVFLKK